MLTPRPYGATRKSRGGFRAPSFGPRIAASEILLRPFPFLGSPPPTFRFRTRYLPRAYAAARQSLGSFPETSWGSALMGAGVSLRPPPPCCCFPGVSSFYTQPRPPNVATQISRVRLPKPSRCAGFLGPRLFRGSGLEKSLDGPNG